MSRSREISRGPRNLRTLHDQSEQTSFNVEHLHFPASIRSRTDGIPAWLSSGGNCSNSVYIPCPWSTWPLDLLGHSFSARMATCTKHLHLQLHIQLRSSIDGVSTILCVLVHFPFQAFWLFDRSTHAYLLYLYLYTPTPHGRHLARQPDTIYNTRHTILQHFCSIITHIYPTFVNKTTRPQDRTVQQHGTG